MDKYGLSVKGLKKVNQFKLYLFRNDEQKSKSYHSKNGEKQKMSKKLIKIFL